MLHFFTSIGQALYGPPAVSVGATYATNLVARFPTKSAWITALKRTDATLLHQYRTSLVRATNGQCRRSVSARPARPMCPINSVPPPPRNPYTIFKDPVGATNLVARFPTKSAWKSAMKRTDATLLHQYRTSLVRATARRCRRSVSTRPTRPLWPKKPVPSPPKNPYTIFKDHVGATY